MRTVTLFHYHGNNGTRSPRREFLLAACLILVLWKPPLSAEQCSDDCAHPTKACLCVLAPGAGEVTITFVNR